VQRMRPMRTVLHVLAPLPFEDCAFGRNLTIIAKDFRTEYSYRRWICPMRLIIIGVMCLLCSDCELSMAAQARRERGIKNGFSTVEGESV
jgi:hypothetical protein